MLFQIIKKYNLKFCVILILYIMFQICVNNSKIYDKTHKCYIGIVFFWKNIVQINF